MATRRQPTDIAVDGRWPFGLILSACLTYLFVINVYPSIINVESLCAYILGPFPKHSNHPLFANGKRLWCIRALWVEKTIPRQQLELFLDFCKINTIHMYVVLFIRLHVSHHIEQSDYFIKFLFFWSKFMTQRSYLAMDKISHQCISAQIPWCSTQHLWCSHGHFEHWLAASWMSEVRLAHAIPEQFADAQHTQSNDSVWIWSARYSLFLLLCIRSQVWIIVLVCSNKWS